VTPEVISVARLKKTFATLTAVDGISFFVKRGECFGLLGPNGAGKTSTIRMLYGYSPVTGGELRLFGQRMSKNWRCAKSRIGICQQEDNLDPDLSVRDNLLTYARYFDLSTATAQQSTEHLLRFFSLEHRAETNIRELSGGMKRRLVLARALINNPDLLILDEPTTGLDPQSRHQVWERLEELRTEGLTILLTTHYMEEAARLCDRLVIMDQGRILVEGKPQELIEKYVGHEVIEISPPDATLQDYLESRGLYYENFGQRLVVHNRADAALFATLADNFAGRRCTLRPATLEDVFLHLTGKELRE
jgi:lipooligosaccharide transport system ATP-binding protein